MMFMILSEFMICDFLYSIFDNTFYVVFMIILQLLSLHIYLSIFFLSLCVCFSYLPGVSVFVYVYYTEVF